MNTVTIMDDIRLIVLNLPRAVRMPNPHRKRHMAVLNAIGTKSACNWIVDWFPEIHATITVTASVVTIMPDPYMYKLLVLKALKTVPRYSP